MCKMILMMSLVFTVLVGGCRQEIPKEDLGVADVSSPNEQSCYYRARIFWVGPNEPTLVSRDEFYDVMFETTKEFKYTSEFVGAGYSSDSPDYVYLELLKPCEDSKRKAQSFFDVYSQVLDTRSLPVDRLGAPEPISQMALESHDQIQD